MKNKIIIIILLVLSITLISCKKNKNKKEEEEMKEVYAQISLSTGDKINLQLYPDKAPKSVENFIKLANEDYLVGTIFHRVIKNFMIQGGGYYLDEFNLKEKSEWEEIEGEFSSNGFDKNDIKHELGVISYARTSNPNSATSQFFICSTTYPSLDGEYAAFGKTTDEESNKVVLKISEVMTINIGYGFTDFPSEPISITKVLISDVKFDEVNTSNE